MLEWIRSWRVGREKRRVGRNFGAAEALRRKVREYDASRCARLVADLAGGDHDLAWVAFQGLQEAPPAALGPLIAALADERFLHPPGASGVEKGHILADFNKPLPRVLRVLAKYQPLPPEATRALGRLAACGDPDVAAHAAKLLAGMGRPLGRKASHPS
jgi:hypothetical protein